MARHGIYVLWGLYYFVLLTAERLIGQARLARVSRVLRHFLTMALVMIGWVLFAIEDFGALGAYLYSLFSPSGGVISTQAGSLGVVLPAADGTCSIGQPAVRRRFRAPEKPKRAGSLGRSGILSAASCGRHQRHWWLQSYNPFLYFRF